jgi:hypothetical protein
VGALELVGIGASVPEEGDKQSLIRGAIIYINIILATITLLKSYMF